MIDESTSKVAMGHLEINGFRATRGHMMETGMDTSIFDKLMQCTQVTFTLGLRMERYIILVIHMRCSGMM